MTALPSRPLAAAAEPAREDLAAILDAQRAAFRASGPASASLGRDRIDRLLVAVLENVDGFLTSLGEDFGGRPAATTLAADVVGALPDLRLIRRRLPAWMRRRRIRVGTLGLAGVRAWVEPQRQGVVGVIAPWNCPVALRIQPTAAALAAGSRIMVKMSGRAPGTAELLQRAAAKHVDSEKLTVVTGGPSVGAACSALPFDHLPFTGSARVGREIGSVAAENLVPLTPSSAARTRRSSRATPTCPVPLNGSSPPG